MLENVRLATWFTCCGFTQRNLVLSVVSNIVIVFRARLVVVSWLGPGAKEGLVTRLILSSVEGMMHAKFLLSAL